MNALLSVNWFDVALLLMLLLGIHFGRKHGMSVESLTLLKWLSIVGLGTLGYRPLGALIGDFSGLKMGANYVIAYVAIALIVTLVFSTLKRRYGEKLEARHLFGKGEYYLGMMGGTFRFLLIALVVMALLHPMSPARGATNSGAKFQEENFGAVFFPTLATMRQDVFERSLTGKWLGENLTFLMIEKPAPKVQAKR
jgi:hypothetical protein